MTDSPNDKPANDSKSGRSLLSCVSSKDLETAHPGFHAELAKLSLEMARVEIEERRETIEWRRDENQRRSIQQEQSRLDAIAERRQSWWSLGIGAVFLLACLGLSAVFFNMSLTAAGLTFVSVPIATIVLGLINSRWQRKNTSGTSTLPAVRDTSSPDNDG
jgi:hypothetical protein